MLTFFFKRVKPSMEPKVWACLSLFCLLVLVFFFYGIWTKHQPNPLNYNTSLSLLHWLQVSTTELWVISNYSGEVILIFYSVTVVEFTPVPVSERLHAGGLSSCPCHMGPVCWHVLTVSMFCIYLNYTWTQPQVGYVSYHQQRSKQVQKQAKVCLCILVFYPPLL